MKLLWILIVIIGVSCSSDNKGAGRGVITETTNVNSARGTLVLEDSTPVKRAYVQIVRAEEIPSAWEGIVYASDTTDDKGIWSISNMYPGAYQAIVISQDSLLMGQAYFDVLEDVDSIPQVPIVLQKRDTLIASYADYANVMDTLSEGLQLRACLRGLGRTLLLDSLGGYSFEGIPKGKHRVKIQHIDGIPGHEFTLWEDWVLVE